MKTLMHVGSKVKAKNIKEINKQILRILATPTGDEVKRAALSALTINLKVKNTSVNNCAFKGKTK